MCVFYMLYFYHRKDRQYIVSSVQEVTHWIRDRQIYYNCCSPWSCVPEIALGM